ncbi:MAG: glycerophosphodiester phosphodiesterase [Clostridia bacterium]|jgi:glycerophosphoryl diester phosphodiesterase|nr:glycerophosphodiester phosphodiesterase [Clostridia bacterium]
MKKQLWLIILMAPIFLIMATLLVSMIMSPPKGGKVLAEKAGLPYPAVIAHRGVSYLAPEGTLPSYLLAREMGVHYLEADLQRTKDGRIIAFHDDSPLRTTNVTEIYPGRKNDHIETFTLEELLQLDAGSWFNLEYPERARESYRGLKILTLEELIDIAETGHNNPGLYLEIKAPHRQPGIEEEIVVNVARFTGRVVFQSFYPESIKKLKVLAPEVPRVQLISSEMAAEDGFYSLLKEAALSAQGIGPTGYLGWPWYTGAAHGAGLVVHHYTINARWQMRLLTFLGADGLFTDRSELALAVLGKTKMIDMDTVFRQIGY